MNGEKETKKTSLSSAKLRQKVIYFQSEAAKYKFLSDKYEWLISEVLKSKPLDSSLEKVDAQNNKKAECTSYFNYSIIQDKGGDPFIYGSYILKNTGNLTLYSPVICLKVNEPKLTIIGGKIGEIESSEDKLIDSFEEWSYLHQDWRKKWQEQGELWLKPKLTTKIEPSHKLIFSGFDITFKNSTTLKPIIVEGYCYFQQINTGVKSLNSISVTL